MKAGKFIQLGYYKNIKLGYGTVDSKNLKTIYIKLNSWLEPNDIIDFRHAINKSRKSILKYIFNLNSSLYKKECIVDMDIRTSGIKLNKKSFMDLEITLYVNEIFDIKDSIVKDSLLNLMKNIIDTNLMNDAIFNFNKTKK